MRLGRTAGPLFFLVVILLFSSCCFADEEYQATVQKYEYREPDLTVVGTPKPYNFGPEDTLLDIARPKRPGLQCGRTSFSQDGCMGSTQRQKGFSADLLGAPAQPVPPVGDQRAGGLQVVLFRPENFNRPNIPDRNRRRGPILALWPLASCLLAVAAVGGLVAQAPGVLCRPCSCARRLATASSAPS